MPTPGTETNNDGGVCMRVTVNGVVRTARVGTSGHVLLTNGSEIEGVVLPSGRVVWTGEWAWEVADEQPGPQPTEEVRA
jgi:hypothetical protein